MNSNDILNAIDLGKINLTDKKKRGRPKKSQQVINPISNKTKNFNDAIFDQEDEIILHLPISSRDIQTLKNSKIPKISKVKSNFDVSNDSDNSLNFSKTKNENKKINLNNLGNSSDEEDFENQKDFEKLDKENINNLDDLDDSDNSDSDDSNDSNDSNSSNNFEKETDGDSEKNESNIMTNKINNSREILSKLKIYENEIRRARDENEKLKKYLLEITPMYFTEVKTYPIELKIFDNNDNEIIPKKTNICCWWCTYQFDCLPSFIPEKYHGGKFYVSGCFCSFNCAGAYNLSLNDNRIWERYALMKQLYYIINKNKITSISEVEINVAGPKELLEKFGGPMGIDEYRKNSKILGREYHKLMPPFFPINGGFEETTNNKTNSKTININNLINPNSKDNIIIKRNKPLNSMASKEIDSFIE